MNVTGSTRCVLPEGSTHHALLRCLAFIAMRLRVSHDWRLPYIGLFSLRLVPRILRRILDFVSSFKPPQLGLLLPLNARAIFRLCSVVRLGIFFLATLSLNVNPFFKLSAFSLIYSILEFCSKSSLGFGTCSGFLTSQISLLCLKRKYLTYNTFIQQCQVMFAIDIFKFNICRHKFTEGFKYIFNIQR